MRPQRRPRLVGIGVILLIALLVGKATVTMMSGRLGWTNYWGGPVFAPFVLVAAVLFIIAAVKLRQEATERRHRRKK
jgi:4-hydroxybenzoate polyprenyltransferase